MLSSSALSSLKTSSRREGPAPPSALRTTPLGYDNMSQHVSVLEKTLPSSASDALKKSNKTEQFPVLATWFESSNFKVEKYTCVATESAGRLNILDTRGVPLRDLLYKNKKHPSNNNSRDLTRNLRTSVSFSDINGKAPTEYLIDVNFNDDHSSKNMEEHFRSKTEACLAALKKQKKVDESTLINFKTGQSDAGHYLPNKLCGVMGQEHATAATAKTTNMGLRINGKRVVDNPDLNNLIPEAGV